MQCMLVHLLVYLPVCVCVTRQLTEEAVGAPARDEKDMEGPSDDLAGISSFRDQCRTNDETPAKHDRLPLACSASPYLR